MSYCQQCGRHYSEPEDERGDHKANIAIICFWSIVIGILGLAFGLCLGTEIAHREAITAGSAVWQSDKNGSPKIQWLRGGK